MAKKYHPDANNNNGSNSEDSEMHTKNLNLNKEELNKEKFQQVQMAYEVLSNDEKRNEYDSYKGRSYYENQYEFHAQGQGSEDYQKQKGPFKEGYENYKSQDD